MPPLKAYYWLSFGNPQDGFIGVCVVQSENTLLHAVKEAVAQKCHPGRGEMVGFQLRENLTPDPAFLNRLLTWEEAEYLQTSMMATLPINPD
jgi:hypothetical protein